MQEQQPDQPSLLDRGKEALGRAARPVTSAMDSVTGRRLESEVAEYSETFTQVALGMHQDLAAVSRRLEEAERAIRRLEEQVANPSANRPPHRSWSWPWPLRLLFRPSK